MVTHPLIEGIHAISGQAEPYIPWVRTKLSVLHIE
jgi:hypothetical protein